MDWQSQDGGTRTRAPYSKSELPLRGSLIIVGRTSLREMINRLDHVLLCMFSLIFRFFCLVLPH